MSITTVLPPPNTERRIVSSAGNGDQHWRTDYLGVRGQEASSPEAFLIEMTPNETLLPHFHAVDQFQVFVEGFGTLGRDAVFPMVVHYADHHTGYGPIVASNSGLSYFTFRPTTDPGAVYLNKPGYREKLKPSLKRHSTSKSIVPAIQPVLRARDAISIERLLQDLDGNDGVGASVLRMGPEMCISGASSIGTGGQYFMVINGSILLRGEDLPRWTIVFQGKEGEAIDLRAGMDGAELLQLAFPQRDAHQQ